MHSPLSSCTPRSCTDGAADDADGMIFDQLIIAANTSELLSHIAVLDSAALLFKALSARKISSFAAFGGGRDRAMNREALDEHEATLDLLSGQYTEVRALLGVLRAVLLLLRLPALQLSCMGYDSPSDLSLAQIRVDRLDKAEDMMFLSDCIRSDELLVDLLVDRTHPQVRSTDLLNLLLMPLSFLYNPVPIALDLLSPLTPAPSYSLLPLLSLPLTFSLPYFLSPLLSF